MFDFQVASGIAVMTPRAVPLIVGTRHDLK
jgi:hypothetical protein